MTVIIRNIIRQLTFIVLMLNLVGCNNDFSKEESSNYNQDVQKNSVKENSVKVDSGISYLGMRLKDESTTLKSNTLFTIETSDQFTPLLEIINGFNSEQKYRVMFLIDYKPINFFIDGKEFAFFDTNIAADTTKKINIAFPKLNDGQHDLTTIIIREPDKILTEPNFIPGNEHVIAHRSNIIVSTNSINLPEFINVNSQPSTLSYGGNIFISQDPNLNNQNPISIIDSGELKDIWLSFKNESEVSNYAILTINIMETTKPKVKFITTNSSGVIKLPMELPKISSPSNFVIIAVENPFTTDTKIPLLSNKFSIK